MSSLCERECIERAGRRAEMPLGQMKVDCGDLEITMTEQDLNRAQVGAGFEKVGRKTVAQSVRMNAPVVETSAFSSDLARRP